MEQSDNSALPEELALNHQELKNIASTGAKHVLEGASQFFVRPYYDLNRWKNSKADLEQSFHANLDWSQHMLQDVGDRIHCIAERTNQTSDAVLKHIYYYAVPVANLLQDGQRLAGASWIHQYAETVAKQLELQKEDPYAAPTPGSVDGLQHLFKHPAAQRQSAALYVLFIAIPVFLYFLLTDPSAFLNNRFALLSLVVVGFLVFLGVVLVYVWVRKRIRATRSRLHR